jgi:hypothetical protein
MNPGERASGRPFLLASVAWLAIAIAAADSGRLSQLHPPVPQLILLGLTVLLIAAGIGITAFHSWLEEVDLRTVLALHLTRFVGAYFLVLYSRGELPWAFAVPGGWGDIAVAALALLLLLAVAPSFEDRPAVLFTWNLIGFLDIIFVVATAARLGITDPASMSALQRLPLSLLPTFLVPLIIASHVLMFWRLRPKRKR